MMVQPCDCGEEEQLASLAAVHVLLSSLLPGNVLTAHPPTRHATLHQTRSRIQRRSSAPIGNAWPTHLPTQEMTPHQTRSRIQRLIGADRRRMVDTPTSAADNPAQTRSRILLRGAYPNRGPQHLSPTLSSHMQESIDLLTVWR
jgi:hypothetical protein